MGATRRVPPGGVAGGGRGARGRGDHRETPWVAEIGGGKPVGAFTVPHTNNSAAALVMLRLACAVSRRCCHCCFGGGRDVAPVVWAGGTFAAARAEIALVGLRCCC